MRIQPKWNIFSRNGTRSTILERLVYMYVLQLLFLCLFIIAHHSKSFRFECACRCSDIQYEKELGNVLSTRSDAAEKFCTFDEEKCIVCAAPGHEAAPIDRRIYRLRTIPLWNNLVYSAAFGGSFEGRD